MLNIGHRGAMGYEPENTLRSFQKALELGVDMIELDVYICKTGELVVIHDNTLKRTTNGHGRVSRMTLDALRSFDAGKGEKIPLLSEVLDLVHRKVPINIELKGPHTAAPTAALIEQYVTQRGWAYTDFLVSAFNLRELKKYHELQPQVRISALIEHPRLTYARFAQKIGAYAVSPSIRFTSQRYVDDAHKRGLKIFVWTVNEQKDIDRMKSMGVDGIFTNFPDRAK